jgi:hypothetical protein
MDTPKSVIPMLPIQWTQALGNDAELFFKKIYTLRDAVIAFRNHTYNNLQVYLSYQDAEEMFGASFLHAMAVWQDTVKQNPELKTYTTPFWFKETGDVLLRMKIKGALKKDLNDEDRIVSKVKFRLVPYHYEDFTGIFVDVF